MKKYQLILVISLLGFCFTEDQDQCFTDFETKLGIECTNLDASCLLTDYSPRCISINNNNCHNGDGDEYICNRIFPSDYPRKICKYDSSDKCNEYQPGCDEYSSLNDFVTFSVTFDSYADYADYCSKLNGGDKKSCHLTSSSNCRAYYDDCEDITDLSECNTNIPADHTKICKTIDGRCKQDVDNRVCNGYIYDVTEAQCHQLKAPSNEKACVYSNGVCKAEFIKCEDIQSYGSSYYCNGKYPLIKDSNNNYDYDYRYKCVFRSGTKCSSSDRECLDYKGDDESECLNLKPASSDQSKKRCFFNSTRTTNKCHEIYKTCEAYNDDVSSKYSHSRGFYCEGIKLLEENQKCIYIRENDTCITGRIYSTCEDYDGSDKYTCESIKSNKTNAYCVLTSDSKCVERKDANMTCEEAFDEEDCLFYAKPVDTRKKCIYSGNKCREVFKRCEDSYEATSDNCSNIRLYNGKECYYESNLCRSRDKVCGNAINKDECALMSKTGVSNPDKRVCDYTSSGCIENYKFCSDYRGNSTTICERIKPYDKSGSYVDLTSECKINDDGRCQRVSKWCGEADGNPIRCNIISQKMKDNHINHCVYKIDKCNIYKKKCEDITPTTILDPSNFEYNCTHNIPDDYLNYYCDVVGDYRDKCVTKKKCHAFKEEYHADLCNEIKPNCLYDSNGCHEEKEDVCEKKVFFTVRDGNKAICESIEASSPNKLCTINEDNTACIEIFKNLTSSDNTTVGNSSEFLMKGIQFISIILSLLIFI